MAGYQLFFSGLNEPSAATSLEMWFPEICENSSYTFLEKGPNDNYGTLVSWLIGDMNRWPKTSIHGNQEWQPFPKSGDRNAESVWLGTETNSPVMPCDLARAERYQGNDIQMGDGEMWHIPSAQKLPHKYKLGGDGEAVRVVEERFSQFYDRAMELMAETFTRINMWDDVKNAIKVPDSLSNQDQIETITVQDGIAFCSMALSLNYRITREIALMLGLLDEQSNQQVVLATFEMQEILSVLSDDQKKTEDRVTIPVG